MKLFINKVYQVYLGRLREFYRDKASLYWNLFFPFFIIVIFYFIFSEDKRTDVKVGVVGEVNELLLQSEEFFNLKYTQFLSVNKEEGLLKVRNHKFDMLIEPGMGSYPVAKYWVNSTNKNAYFLEKIIKNHFKGAILKQSSEEKEISYLDWVFPGILALNLMFSCLWGVGWVIVKYRDEGFLKRLNATPLKVYHFLLGHMFARLIIVAIVTTFIFVVGSMILDFKMQGSYFDLIVCYFFGMLSLTSIGLLVATRTTSKEFAEGALNLFSWPMIVCSGMWFSIEGFSPLVKAFSYTLPTTHLIEATRKIMLEGATLSQVSVNIFSMFLFSVILFALTSFFFKWSER